MDIKFDEIKISLSQKSIDIPPELEVVVVEDSPGQEVEQALGESEIGVGEDRGLDNQRNPSDDVVQDLRVRLFHIDQARLKRALQVLR